MDYACDQSGKDALGILKVSKVSIGTGEEDVPIYEIWLSTPAPKGTVQWFVHPTDRNTICVFEEVSDVCKRVTLRRSRASHAGFRLMGKRI